MGAGLGRKDKDKDDSFTKVDRSSFATTILPIYPREAPLSFVPDDAQTSTRHMSRRSKTSYASKQTAKEQSHEVQRPAVSGRSKRSNDPLSQDCGSVNTLIGSALERKEAYRDPIYEHIDTSFKLRQLMAKDNLNY
jgi:hypothetical protein